MKHSNRPVIVVIAWTLIVFYITSFIALLIYSGLKTVLDNEVLSRFRFQYVSLTGISLFIKYLIPIQSAGLMVAYSLVLKPGEKLAGRQSFSSFISSTMVLLIILTSFYTFFSIAINPLIQRRIQENRQLSLSAREFLKKAGDFEEKKNHAQAVFYYNLYLSLDDSSDEIRIKKEDIIDELLKVSSEAVAEADSLQEQQPEEKGEYDSETLLNMSRSYMENEDYLSAHYYADLAKTLDPENKAAEILKNETKRMLNSYNLTKSEKNSAEFFKKKLEAYNTLERKDYIEAYYLFKELSIRHPEEDSICSV